MIDPYYWQHSDRGLAAWGMDKDVEAEIGAGFPERPQFLRIERQILQFRSNHGARKSELDRAAL